MAGGGGGLSIEQACQRDADLFCDKTAACSEFDLRWFWGDVATCKARDMLWCSAYLGLLDTAVTPDLFAACSGAVAAMTCDDFNSGVEAEACVFKPGSRVEGQACTNGAQCQTHLCKIPKNASCGVCAAKVPVGGACASNSECVSGSRCKGQTCTPEVGVGATCGGTVAACAYPNICLGTCTKPLPVGAPCDPMIDACDYGIGAACDPQSSTCKALVKLASPGQPCGTIDGSQVECVGFGSCGFDTPDATMGTCYAPSADGAPCDDVRSCLWPATCVNGVCQLPSLANSACP
jgi:hypothetical protein